MAQNGTLGPDWFMWSLPCRAAAGRTAMQPKNGLWLQPGPMTTRATRGAREVARRAAEGGPVKAPLYVRGPMKRPTQGNRKAPRKDSWRGSPGWAVTSSWREAMKRTMMRAWRAVVKVGVLSWLPRTAASVPCEQDWLP